MSDYYEIDSTLRRERGIYELIARPVQLHVDADNNDDLDGPSVEWSEEKVKNENGKPGKVLQVSMNDADGNGVPDFADGLDKFDNQAGQFPKGCPLRISQLHWRSGATIKFTYSASDPALITRSGSADEGFKYSLPAEGKLRIWRGPPEFEWDGPCRHVADLLHGGDFVRPGVEYPLEMFTDGGISINVMDVFIEAVKPSTAVGDLVVKIEILHSGASSTVEPYMQDSVRLTSISTSVVSVSEDNSTTSESSIECSHPSPVFARSAIDVGNLRASEDGATILGGLWVAAEVKSAVCDYTAGDKGKILNISVFLNDSQTPLKEVQALSVQKGTQPGSLLHPFPFSAQFGVVLDNVAFPEGINTIRLEAKDPIYGFIGYVEYTIPIVAAYGTGSNSPPPPPLNRQGLISPFSHRALPANPVPHQNGSAGDGDSDDDTWFGYSFFAGQPELANFSDGGEFHPYLVRVEAPVSLFSASSTVTVGNLTRQIIAGANGEYFIRMHSDSAPAIYIAMPSSGAGSSMSVGELEELYYYFAAGVCSGGIDFLEGTYSLCKFGLMEGAKLSPLGTIWEMSYGGHFSSEIALALKVDDALEDTADFISDIRQNDVDIVKGILKGNIKPSYVSQSYRKALSFGAEILGAAEKKFVDLSPEDRAFYSGRIFFEAATITGTLGKAGDLAKLRKANFLEMFAASRLSVETPEIAAAVAEF